MKKNLKVVLEKIVSNLHVNVINKKAKLIKKELNFINH